MTYFTNFPTVGFSETTTLASIQNPSGFLILAAAPRHQNGLNIGYSDGHARFRQVGQLWRTVTDNDFRYDSHQ